MDIAKIPDSPWWPVLADFRKGKVDKAEIIRLLETDAPVPPEANPLLAGLLAGKIRARRGNKPMIHWYARQSAVELALGLEGMIKDPSTIPADYDKETRDWIKAMGLQTVGTPRTKALEFAARAFGMSEATIKKLITARNKRLQAIADKHGVTVGEVKKALGKP